MTKDAGIVLPPVNELVSMQWVNNVEDLNWPCGLKVSFVPKKALDKPTKEIFRAFLQYMERETDYFGDNLFSKEMKALEEIMDFEPREPGRIPRQRRMM